MRPLGEQSYYELLELPETGDERQLERAYRIARATYGPSSVAAYSVFSDQETAAILRRVEEAYTVLSDTKLRREYDRRLQRDLRDQPPLASSPRLDPQRLPGPQPPVWPREPLRPNALEPDEALEPKDGNYDGEVLRRIRLELGMELEEIASITKVNPSYLANIEANCARGLPSPVYVRGFIKELAKCLGLDPKEVADSYMRGHAERLSAGG